MEEKITELLTDILTAIKKQDRPQTMTVKEAAEYSGLSASAIEALSRMKNSDLPVFSVNTKRYIYRSALDEWLKEKAESHASVSVDFTLAGYEPRRKKNA